MALFPLTWFGPRTAGPLAACALSLTLAFASPAAAQTASEKAAAEALFDDGVQLLKKGEYDKACKKLEKSQSVDPGIGTLLYLGECYKKLGRTASAWATFREAASKASAAGEDDRARVGNSRADELEANLSRVTFEVAEENVAIEGLEIVQGKIAVSRALWGTAIPVDPGEVHVIASAPGYEPFELMISVQPGPATMTVTIPALLKSDEEPAAAAAPAAATSVEDKPPRNGDAQRTAGLVIGGVGVVGIGVGSVFGILAISKDHKADNACKSSTTCPDAASLKLATDARTFATVSTIGFAAGGALLAGGLILYFTAPKSSASQASNTELQIAPTYGGAQLSWSGSF